MMMKGYLAIEKKSKTKLSTSTLEQDQKSQKAESLYQVRSRLSTEMRFRVFAKDR